MSQQCTEKPSLLQTCCQLVHSPIECAFGYISVWVTCFPHFLMFFWPEIEVTIKSFLGYRVLWNLDNLLLSWEKINSTFVNLTSEYKKHFDGCLKMLCRATKWKRRHKYHSNTELHNIQQYSFPPNQMKRHVNMNNMFSKCPRLHIRAHTQIKKQDFFFLKPCLLPHREFSFKRLCVHDDDGRKRNLHHMPTM